MQSKKHLDFKLCKTDDEAVQYNFNIKDLSYSCHVVFIGCGHAHFSTYVSLKNAKWNQLHWSERLVNIKKSLRLFSSCYSDDNDS